MNITKEIGVPAMLSQLMEECAELSVAASKIIRILDEVNPPRCTMEEALANFEEEATDVDNCLTWLKKEGFSIFSADTFVEKNQRWEKAVEEAKIRRRQTE